MGSMEHTSLSAELGVVQVWRLAGRAGGFEGTSASQSIHFHVAGAQSTVHVDQLGA